MFKIKFYSLLICVSLLIAVSCGSSDGSGGGNPYTYTWTNVSAYGGFVSSIQFDPSDSSVVWLSGDDASGLYKRTSVSPDWVMITGVPSDWSSYSVEIDPADTDIVYVPNHFGRGLVKTTNGGSTWNTIGTGLPTAEAEKRIEDFAIDPTDHTIVYAACEGGLYRSSDSGGNFAQVVSAQFTESSHFRALEVYDGTPDRVFCANQKGGVYMSLDSGVTWSTVTAASAGGVPVSDLSFSGNALYVAYDFGFLGKSETLLPAGYTVINDASGPGAVESGMWTSICSVGGASTALDILYVGTGEKAASTKWGFFVSTDGGSSFTKKDTIDGNSVFSMDVDPADKDHLILGSISGDVYETLDAGDTWSVVSSGVTATDSLGFYEDPSDPDHLIYSSTAGGLGTHRVYETFNSGTDWSCVTALDFEDFMSFYIDDSDPQIMLGGTFTNGLYRSTGGSGGAWIQVLIPNANCSIREVVPDSADSSRLYAYTDEILSASDASDVGLYFSDDTGGTWTLKLNFAVADIAVHPVNGNEAVAASGDMYATTDNFTAVGNSLGLAAYAPGKLFTACAFDPDNPSRLLVGTSEGDLYLTENYSSSGGCTWSILTNPSSDILIMDVEIEDGKFYVCCWSGDTIAKTTSTPGLMVSRDNGSSWVFADKGMYPSRLAWKLRKSTSVANRFYVGLWGGGFYRFDD